MGRKIYCGESRTKQGFKRECDVNILMAKYQKTGVLPQIKPGQPVYGDFTQVSDYQSAQNMLISAREQFDAMPLNVRKKFNYDPGRFLEFVENPENQQEMIDLGLATKKDYPEAEKNAPTPEPPKIDKSTVQ